MIDSFSKMSLRKYKELNQLIDENKDVKDEDFVPKLVAFLNDMYEDEVLDMKIDDFSKLVSKLTFINKEPNTKKHIPNTYVLNGKKYVLNKNINTITAGQFIDFQEFMKNNLEYEYFISCLLLPEGKTYSETDIQQTIDDVLDYMDVETALSITNFYSALLKASLKRSLRFSAVALKMAMHRAPKEEKKKMKEEFKKIRDLLRDSNG